MRLSQVIFILMLIFTLSGAQAQENSIKRSMRLGWEEIPDSIGYEMELTRVLPGGKKRKPLIFKSKTSQWSGQIVPGRYEMRLRAIDDRGVPGDWSEVSPIAIPLVMVPVKTPADQVEIKTGEETSAAVHLEWSPVPGAAKYLVEFLNSEGVVTETHEVEATKKSLTLNVGSSYRWRVAALSQDGDRGEQPEKPREFTLIGKAITPPSIEKPDTKFVTEVKWAPVEFASKYDYKITRKTKRGKWVKVDQKLGVTDTVVPLDPRKPGGLYRLEVTAHGEKRESSVQSSIEFPVYQGLRTPAAIETAKLRETLDSELDHYFTATYLLTQLTYLGQNKEYNADGPAFTSLAGTGRLGYGYMPKGKFGFLANMDMSGIIIEGKNYLFASADFLFAWRNFIGQATQLRLYGGGFYKEIPELLAFPGQKIEAVKNIAFIGPAAGAQVWHSLSYKLGVQFNLATNLGLFKVATPSGGDLNPSLTTQTGLLFSYRLQHNMTGFAGIAKRLDKVSYKAKPYTGGAEANYASPGDNNTVTMDGTYLNLYLEWGF